MMTEGIYRRSGSSSAVAKLLEAFRRDAWATQITRNSYTEHDVATVLRRFLRDLPNPLFPANIHGRLCLTAGMTNGLARRDLLWHAVSSNVYSLRLREKCKNVGTTFQECKARS